MDPTEQEPSGDEVHGLPRSGRRERDPRAAGGRQTGGRGDRAPGGGPRPRRDPVLRGGRRPDRRPGDDQRNDRDVPRGRYPASRSRPDRPLRPDDRRPPARRDGGPRRGGFGAPPDDYAQSQRHPSAPPRPQGRPGRAGEPAWQPRGPRPAPVRFQPAPRRDPRGDGRDRPPRERLDAPGSPRQDRDHCRTARRSRPARWPCSARSMGTRSAS